MLTLTNHFCRNRLGKPPIFCNAAKLLHLTDGFNRLTTVQRIRGQPGLTGASPSRPQTSSTHTAPLFCARYNMFCMNICLRHVGPVDQCHRDACHACHDANRALPTGRGWGWSVNIRHQLNTQVFSAVCRAAPPVLQVAESACRKHNAARHRLVYRGCLPPPVECSWKCWAEC